MANQTIVTKSMSIQDLERKIDLQRNPHGTSYRWMCHADFTPDPCRLPLLIPEGFTLDRFQRQASQLIADGENIVVCAPTSAGKSFIAKTACKAALIRKQNAVVTQPYKALSNQMYRGLQCFEPESDRFIESFISSDESESETECFEYYDSYDEDGRYSEYERYRSELAERDDSDRMVGILTGDTRLYDSAQIRVMTTEILGSMLKSGGDVSALGVVVFDEFHLMNDEERGGEYQWIIEMLPPGVQIVCLSATIGNVERIAEWIGSVRQRRCWIVSKKQRPVPLGFYLWCGAKLVPKRPPLGKPPASEVMAMYDLNQKRLIPFYRTDDRKYCGTAVQRVRTGLDQPRLQRLSWNQRQNRLMALIQELQRREGLPAIFFKLSRNAIEQQAAKLNSLCLLSKRQQGRALKFYNTAMQRIPSRDRNLEQIRVCRDLARRGIGIHHSGLIAPIREAMEHLMQLRLIQVLFATETIAAGINVPAKTTVLQDVRKFDGKHRRWLHVAEFMQMAGRAGRRGNDTEGNVVICCYQQRDMPDLRRLVCGKPEPIECHFRLRDQTILALKMRSSAVSVQRLMRSSLSESGSQQETALQIMDDIRRFRAENPGHASADSIAHYLTALDRAVSFAQQHTFHCQALRRTLKPGHQILLPPMPSPKTLPTEPPIIGSRAALVRLTVVSANRNGVITKQKEQLIPYQWVIGWLDKESARLRLKKKRFTMNQNRQYEEHWSDIQALLNHSIDWTQVTVSDLRHADRDAALLKEVERLEACVSDEALQLMPRYRERCRTLRDLGFLDKDDLVTKLGRAAALVTSCDAVVLLTWLTSTAAPTDPAMLSGCLTIMIYDRPTERKDQLLAPCLDGLIKCMQTIRPNDTTEPATGVLNATVLWSQGADFPTAWAETDAQPGTFRKALLRTADVLRQTIEAFEAMGNERLQCLCSAAHKSIHRDIVTCQSLYCS